MELCGAFYLESKRRGGQKISEINAIGLEILVTKPVWVACWACVCVMNTIPTSISQSGLEEDAFISNYTQIQTDV